MAKTYVTKPSLAPLHEYTKILEGVWESGILTHNGPLVQQLEKDLQAKLGLEYLVAVTNGTVALQLAIKALELQGEIITSPFTWVATVSAIKWEGCSPVFCDIDPETLNIDPDKIEALITDKTVAIMPVHVFGVPCDVDKIDAIAKKHGLKVIYDAAHAIGSEVDGKSVLDYGDISATSFHATKLFNTGEGGGCITTDPGLFEKLRRIRFFGHDAQGQIVEDGCNGKMTEIHAALGLANLKYYDEVFSARKAGYALYKELLGNLPGVSFQECKVGVHNSSYFTVIFENEQTLLSVVQKLNEKNLYPRRYFYPSVNTFSKIVDYQPAPISEDISPRILALPLFWELESEIIEQISSVVLGVLGN
ncbi:DegT/DnrJ/EryC1/StrS family aminotransferase [Marinifilum sp. JC120]|nr:DegT/DnrJ/EryC1/StrS family aminotransferase [Marinifilum sp. JC120]